MEAGNEIDAAIAGDMLVVPECWAGFPGRAFGGFLAAAALRVAKQRSQQPRAISLHGRFFRATPIGKAIRIEHAVDHAGRSSESLGVKLWDGERLLAAFAVQLGKGSVERYTSQGLEVPKPIAGMQPVHEFLAKIGQVPTPHMRHVRFEGNVMGPPGEPFANRWPAKTGEVDLAAVMCADNFVGPATWRSFGDMGNPEAPSMPTIDVTAWFHDVDAVGGWLDSRTEIVAANSGLSTGRTQVWSGERLVATGVSAVMAVPAP